jgi:predicted transcriptional regulator
MFTRGKKKTPNAQRRTPNIELRDALENALLEFEIGRSALGVRRFLSLKLNLFAADYRTIFIAFS